MDALTVRRWYWVNRSQKKTYRLRLDLPRSPYVGTKQTILMVETNGESDNPDTVVLIADTLSPRTVERRLTIDTGVHIDLDDIDDWIDSCLEGCVMPVDLAEDVGQIEGLPSTGVIEHQPGHPFPLVANHGARHPDLSELPGTVLHSDFVLGVNLAGRPIRIIYWAAQPLSMLSAATETFLRLAMCEAATGVALGPPITGRSVDLSLWFTARPDGRLLYPIDAIHGYAGAGRLLVRHQFVDDVHEIILWFDPTAVVAPSTSVAELPQRAHVTAVEATVSDDESRRWREVVQSLDAGECEVISGGPPGDGTDTGRARRWVLTGDDGTIVPWEALEPCERAHRAVIAAHSPTGKLIVDVWMSRTTERPLLDAIAAIEGVLSKGLPTALAQGAVRGAVPPLELARRPANEARTNGSATLQAAEELVTTIGGQRYRHSSPDRESMLIAANALARNPGEPDRVAHLLAETPVSATDLLALPRGLRLLAILLAEDELERLDPESGDDDLSQGAEVLGAALTVMSGLTVSYYPHTNFSFVSRLNNLAFEWVLRRQSRPWRAMRRVGARSPEQRLALNRLLQAAPFLLFSVETAHLDLPITLTPHEFVDALALGRPRQTHRPGNNSTDARTYKTTSYPIDVDLLVQAFVVEGAEQLLTQDHAADLDALARAVEVLYCDPLSALHRLQALDIESPVVDEAASMARMQLNQVAGSPDDLLVVADRPPRAAITNALVFNTSGTRRLTVQATASTYQLYEFAPMVADATGYAAGPFAVEGPLDLVVEGEMLRWDVEPRTSRELLAAPATSHRIGGDLFQGRGRLLSSILVQAAPDLVERLPVLIYGTRRAGKSTLAIRAANVALEQGLVTAFAVVDVDKVVYRTLEDPARCSSLLAKRIAGALREASVEADLPIDGVSTDDVIDFLDDLDRAMEDQRMAIVLDEFDALLVTDQSREFRRLASQLGKCTFRNLVLVATAQRFHRRAVELPRWSALECPPDLLWEDAMRYFCPPISRAERRVLAKSPMLPPAEVRQVVNRLGLRPYLWAALRSKMEGLFRSDPERTAFYELHEINEILDELIETDPYLRSPLQDAHGLSIAECRLQDVFSDGERHILAHFAQGAKGVELSVAEAAGGHDALRELLDRQYTVIVGTQLQPAVPIFGEFLRRHAAEFPEVATPLDVARSDAMTRLDEPSPSGHR